MFEELRKIYSQLAPSSTSQLRFHNCSLRDIDAHGGLQRPFFKIALCLGHQAAHGNHPMSIMVTASHNPPGYNGVKIDHLLEGFSLNEASINGIMHCQEDVLEILGDKQVWKQGQGIFYLGRDKRPTSLKLCGIIGDVLGILGYKLIDLGEKTTPEMVSLSEFLHEKHMKGIQFCPQLVDSYFSEIEKAFSNAMKIANHNSGIIFHKKTICLDFANGVGCQSFKRYNFLSEYFNIIQTNYSEFDKPNVQCGAEWIYKYYKQHGVLPCLEKYPEAEQYFFFDGDSDRVVAIKKGYSEIFNGDDFNAHFIHILRILFDRLYPNQLIGCVGNLTSNNGLTKYAKQMNVNFQIAAVGVNHLFKLVRNYEIGCYFQPSGHGGFYFSQKMKGKLQQIASQRWEAQLLLALDNLSKNNPRGYALHNMLIFQIISNLLILRQWKLLQKSYEISKQFHLQHSQLFSNTSSGCKLLEKPQQFKKMMQKVCLKYPSETILLRKSITSPILKLFIQGQKSICFQILQQTTGKIQSLLSKF